MMLPECKKDDPYFIGFFLVGAYQEILGNLHNLFGDTNSLELKLLDGGRFEIADLVTGDTIANVLNAAHYDTKKLIQSYERQLIKANLSSAEIFSYTNELRGVFSQLTYLSGGLV
jgi:arginine decarboxylase